MPTVTNAKSSTPRIIEALRLSRAEASATTRDYLGLSAPETSGAIRRLEHDLTLLQTMYRDRMADPMPANLTAELRTVRQPAKRLLNFVSHLHTDATFTQPVPSLSVWAEFSLWGAGTVDLAQLRTTLTQLIANIDGADTDPLYMGGSHVSMKNRHAAALRKDLRQALANLFVVLASSAKRANSKSKSEFIAWALERIMRAR